ncbi:hypothetical protein PCC7418_0198 [Halothece sp. PCC 7418]|uniref:Nif11-like leader peptide family natural product precursor n=1 Tax=Halothece sp. (strain PCC 7418) TaxID=65093 RepID=UPI0002A05B62|nr:Nif11-like leader peptide family natural product precursor [Halothece sp. PCC 7418]AFZ42436.1 hypothetical protein PCC7418_0198 [Halothece sp. PCC 7418]
MSYQAVQLFLQELDANSALQEEAMQVLETTTSPEQQAAAITELAASKGYEFSKEELKTAVKNRQRDWKERKAKGELSENELDSVSGGHSPEFSNNCDDDFY